MINNTFKLKSKNNLVINLSKLPFSETYAKKFTDKPDPYNQKFIFNNEFQHGYIKNVLPTENFYNQNYFLRTADSLTSSRGTLFFLKFVNKYLINPRILIDIGCNDLFLINQFKNNKRYCIGVDPIQKNEKKSNLLLIGRNFEDAKLDSFNGKINAVFCRHTIEHIKNLEVFFEKLQTISSSKTQFFFEFPSLDLLVENLRFDQIFHQHLQYFSLYSFNKLINRYNFQIIDIKFNYHHWGALLVYFKRRSTKMKKINFNKNPILSKNILIKNYNLFKNNMLTLRKQLLNIQRKELYFFGASQMLPIILYHLKIDPSSASAIIDDDKTKHQLTYSNIPLKIIGIDKIKNISSKSFLITAPDSSSAIFSKLIKLRPKNIFSIFQRI